MQATGGETDGPLKNGLTRNVVVESQSKNPRFLGRDTAFL